MVYLPHICTDCTYGQSAVQKSLQVWNVWDFRCLDFKLFLFWLVKGCWSFQQWQWQPGLVSTVENRLPLQQTLTIPTKSEALEIFALKRQLAKETQTWFCTTTAKPRESVGCYIYLSRETFWQMLCSFSRYQCFETSKGCCEIWLFSTDKAAADDSSRNLWLPPEALVYRMEQKHCLQTAIKGRL